MENSIRLQLVQAQLHAYNSRDLNLFCKQYHDDVEVYSRKTSRSEFELLFSGMEKFRSVYSTRFSENKDLHCNLVSRIVLGEHVIDEELVQEVIGQPRTHVVAVYGFQDNLIKTVLFLR